MHNTESSQQYKLLKDGGNSGYQHPEESKVSSINRTSPNDIAHPFSKE